MGSQTNSLGLWSQMERINNSYYYDKSSITQYRQQIEQQHGKLKKNREGEYQIIDKRPWMGDKKCFSQMKNLLNSHQEEPLNFFNQLIELKQLIKELKQLKIQYHQRTLPEYLSNLFPKRGMTLRMWINNICDTFKVISNYKINKKMQWIQRSFTQIMKQIINELSITQQLDFSHSTQSTYIRYEKYEIPFDIESITQQTFEQLLSYKCHLPKFMKVNLKNPQMKSMTQRRLMINEMNHYKCITKCLENIQTTFSRLQ